MINQLKSKLEELEIKKNAIKPKINEINLKREEEIQTVNKKYDHMVYELNYEIQKFEDDIYNELIQSFVDITSRELDIKRSTELYSVSDDFKEYRESIARLENFPEELVEKLHRVINGDPIENIIYELEDIKEKYLRK
ncbi:hypothetical protein LCGC14_0891340 [marine sediment metagenome]|uniref:Uncharacterized protein n=1 Tax=marine sediment metagenome TaxID=412755 RepID=A0A0F9NZ92_9ZZZZ|nr:MAG: hypothetical protein Lokiarch_31400 [Candidatus Lokiarchaeum sp. GC14_75]